MKNKKVFIIMLVAFLVGAPVFAADAALSDGKAGGFNISFIKKAVNLIVGIFAGGYVLIKAALDIFHAVRNSSEDQNALKKAIGGFVLNAAVLGGFFFVLNYVFGKATGDGQKNGAISGDNAQSDFFGALSGAEVAASYVLGL